ncbi:MAG: hypothetical protein K8I29_10805 [Alphaproteobacteria bacterium]|uniref:Uncharacterized protein n=1 Tax=Candidatus Nitrobium versatile TaxID=2884831 RepID=A0A953JFA8_9BACT|nr:hypothetical protein [Candidatus Nitrobium versatile]
MSFGLKIRSAVSSLFLLCFLLYTASPLAFSYRSNDAPDSYTKPIEVSVQNFHLFLLKLFASGIAQHSGQDNGSSSVTFLLKKKRAVVRSNILVHPVDVPAPDLSAALSDALPRLPDLSPAPYHDEPDSLDGFQRFSSGLSPPSA